MDKQAPSQAILIYTLKRTTRLAEQVNPDKLPFLNQRLRDVTTATLAVRVTGYRPDDTVYASLFGRSFADHR
ncbi:hypothetical protein [Paenibacillus sp. 23TSA30-6]|uniref:hypothetical protein n=1 Tax=Paenibacillus sp. 23TSA30-6 TaxID=2546104 RepID=UPI001787F09D|nr:hypothetical protein [Paenibacillus sp. 23TSA30-6]MBE0338254.1 hypothetical protein [Paenibacillus sp. 23TSA30-6]